MLNKIRMIISFIPILTGLLLFGYLIYFMISFWNSPDIFTDLVHNLKKMVLQVYISFENLISKHTNGIERFSLICVVVIILAKVLHFLLKKLYKHIIILLTIPCNILFEFNKFKLLVKTYVRFLTRYIKISYYTKITQINKDLIYYLLHFDEIPLKGEKRIVFTAFYEEKEFLIQINKDLKKHIEESCYISKYKSCGGNKEKYTITSPEINNHVLNSKLEDNYKKFLSYKSSDTYSFRVLSGGVEIIKKPIENWETRTKENFILPKKEINLGFTNVTSSQSRDIQDLNISYQSLSHSFLVGATRKGKDVLMLNIVHSLLYNIKHFNNSFLHFFDTKGSDGAYLDGLREYGIFRYNDSSEYIKIVKKIYSELTNRQKRLGVHANIQEYNKNNPKNSKKEVFIVINELLSLGNKLDKKDSESLYQVITSILSEGASVGIHVLLMSQTIRKDSHPKLGTALVNIQNYFVLQVNGEDERNIVGKGLTKEEKEKLRNQILYNCFHISESKIKSEFRAYNISQQILLQWIKQNFDRDNQFEDEKQNNYYNYIIKNKNISRVEAIQDFGLNEKKWQEIILVLKEKNLISEKKGKGYYFLE